MIVASCGTQNPITEIINEPKGPTFDPQVNCTKRGLDFLNKDKKTPDKPVQIAMIKKSSAPIVYNAVKKCVDTLSPEIKAPYQICTIISSDKKGKATFIDVDDNNNKLPEPLKKCIEGQLKKASFKEIHSITFGQPMTILPSGEIY